MNSTEVIVELLLVLVPMIIGIISLVKSLRNLSCQNKKITMKIVRVCLSSINIFSSIFLFFSITSYFGASNFKPPYFRESDLNYLINDLKYNYSDGWFLVMILLLSIIISIINVIFWFKKSHIEKPNAF
ncbi:MAG: hypothetical protein PHU94_04395 [Bacilli bacterium]|nr:hypothetical protein [Bacilli bacterium]MDD4407314.1 hypothetical protein [Bacilli bacterium]